MKFDLNSMYKYLLSHTFPGLLVGIEVLFCLHWFVEKPDFWNYLSNVWTGKTGNVLTILILAYAISTLLGFIVDGVHHFLFEDIWKLILKKTCDDGSKKFEALSSPDIVQIYQYCLDEDNYYAYESYANISIAMAPGLALLWYWLICRLKVVYLSLGFAIPFGLYLITLIIMIFEAANTYKLFKEDHKNFIDTFSKKQNLNH